MFSGLFMYLISLILCIASGVFKKVPNQRSTKGIITSTEQRQKSHNGMITRTGVVSYVVNGKSYIVKTSYQSSFFRKGKKLTICYNSENPQESFVKTEVLIYIFIIASAIAGTVYIISDIINLLNYLQ